MCRIEEKVYWANGRRQTFEDSFLCHKARKGKLCADVTRKTIEYQGRPQQIARAESSSPASFDPPTPNSSGTYVVQERRPSGTIERRPSTRDGTRTIKPALVITLGKKKDKSKKYHGTSSNSYKRSSLGTASIGSDIAVESPGSEASYTLRTGFPEASVAPTDPPSYNTRPAVPQSHHRHTSSASSFTTSSQPPSLYATSDPDSPSGRRPARYPPTIVHNPLPGSTSAVPPASPTTLRASVPAPSSPYRTTIARPRDSGEIVGADNLFPVNYTEFQGRSNSSHASSAVAAAPEITGRDAERARQRKSNAEAEKKRQEQEDYETAKALAKEDEAKQVRFELDRANYRANQRAENQYAHKEKERAEDREAMRQRRNKEEADRAARVARDEEAKRLRDDIARRERDLNQTGSKHRRSSRPPTRDLTARPARRNSHSRRNSMSQQDIIEQQRLLAETQAQMARERELAEQRERDERAAELLQQQQTPQYWSARGGDPSRVTVTNNGPGIGRRGSVSGRRGSISSTAPPVSVVRTNSQRRVSISQPAPPGNVPPINTTFPSQHASRPPSSYREPGSTPLFSSGSAVSGYGRPPSARHSSYDRENPFAQPLARTSATSQDNPFAPAGQPTTLDPWDARDMRDALPRDSGLAPTHNRQPSDDRQHRTLRRRGEEVIDSSAPRDRARQATRNMGKVVGFEGDYLDSDSEDEPYGARLGVNKPGKKKH